MADSKTPLSVTPELTRKVAGLARLKLSDAEVTQFTEQLGRVLGYIESLKTVDTSDQSLEPMTTPLAMATPLRQDREREFPRTAQGQSKVLENAPKTLFDGFQVPPIL